MEIRNQDVAGLRGRTPFAATSSSSPSPVEDVEKYLYQSADAADDHSRMVANAVAAAIFLVLIVSGIWLADTIVTMRNIQDCALSGRRNCAPIERPVRPPA